MSNLNLKVWGVKGTSPKWNENKGGVTAFIDCGNSSNNFIAIDAFEGTGTQYKRRDKSQIEVYCAQPAELGATQLEWSGTFEELVTILRNHKKP